jgi:hypothetical protein
MYIQSREVSIGGTTMILPSQRIFSVTMVVAAATLAACSAACVAQNSDSRQTSNSDLALHANTQGTAAAIGLPEYPGASPYKDPNNKKNSDSAVDLGMNFGHAHFQIKAVSYTTPGSPAQVLNFYRKPLSQYGQVLECDHGRPIGSLKVTRSGLTCNNDSLTSSGAKDDASGGHELRAGSPTRYRLVGIDKSHPGSTRFGLVYIELPKTTDQNEETK